MSWDSYAEEWHILQAKNKNNFAHKYLEKPAMKKLLPKNMQDGNVLLLGCGSGEEIELFESGSNLTFMGLDSSKLLIEYAATNYPQHKFEVQDLASWQPDESLQYDFVYSSLTFHYIENWNLLFSKIYKSLKAGGEVLFSLHHPIKWGSKTIRTKEYNKFVLGYKKSKNGSVDSFYGDYLNPRAIEDILFGKINITHYHKPISKMVEISVSSGFTVEAVVEPLPVEESKIVNPSFYNTYSKIPLFLIFKIRKNLHG